MSPETMQKMRGMMDQARQKMQQQLQSMPEEQRKRFEAMMAQQGGGPPGSAQPAAPTYEKAGSARTVGNWSCAPYRANIGMSGKEEFCIARLSDVGLTSDDLKGMKSFTAFMRQGFAPEGGPAGFDYETMSKAIGFDGVPVQTTHYGEDGMIDMQSTIKSIDHESVPAAAFDLPAGYTKKDMPGGRMGPPGGE
jgi:hypothetical protein